MSRAPVFCKVHPDLWVPCPQCMEDAEVFPMTDTTAPRTAAGKRLADAIGEVGDGLSPAAWDILVDPDAAITAIEVEAIEPLLALVRAARRVQLNDGQPVAGVADDRGVNRLQVRGGPKPPAHSGEGPA